MNPKCPRCGETDWGYWEAGNYRANYEIEMGSFLGEDRPVFKRYRDDEDRESSHFWCRSCQINEDDDFRGDENVSQEAWDTISDQLYELRESASFE